MLEAPVVIKLWRVEYNMARPHSSLGGHPTGIGVKSSKGNCFGYAKSHSPDRIAEGYKLTLGFIHGVGQQQWPQ